MTKHPYGFCPVCGEPGNERERRPDGNDTCVNEHTYPSRNALKEKPKSDLLPCPFCGGEPYKEWCEEGCCNASLRAVSCKCGANIWADKESVDLWNKRTEPSALDVLLTLQSLLLCISESHIKRGATISAYGLKSLAELSQMPGSKMRSLTGDEAKGVHDFIMSHMKPSESIADLACRKGMAVLPRVVGKDISKYVPPDDLRSFLESLPDDKGKQNGNKDRASEPPSKA